MTATWVATAAAQTPAAQAGATSGGAPVINMGYGGLIAGSGSVANSSRVIGGEAGARVWRNLDLFLEGASIADVVPERQLALAAPLTAFLQQTQGKAATATVKMPASYFAFGARWVFENVNLAGWAKPYAQFAVGGGKIERQPTFTLGGQDVTSSLASYGVVLGADMTAEEKGTVVSGGAGVLVPFRMIYGDVGFRITSFGTSGDSISVNRFHIGVGVRF
jgi:hypothetical protein